MIFWITLIIVVIVIATISTIIEQRWEAVNPDGLESFYVRMGKFACTVALIIIMFVLTAYITSLFK